MLRTTNGCLFAGDHKVLRGWESFSGWYWLGVEEVEPGIWFGLIQGHDEEWGYFSAEEIKSLGNMAWEILPQDLPYAGRRR